jgi:hypothetical protein
MLRLSGGQVESLFDEVLPIEVRQLPGDLVVLDELLGDRALFEPVERAWAEAARRFGRPSVPIDRFVRLMIVKHRSGWGYETLVREVSDSLHLRRFCLLALSERVPDESTIRKLARRLGPEVVEEICRHVVAGRDGRGARAALHRAGGADRLDRGRGRRALPDRHRPGRRRRRRPGTRSEQGTVVGGP